MDPDALLSHLNPAQREAVTSAAAPLAILAGAGSGKTRVLTHRIAWRAATDQVDPRRVLALTFTRKAAGELRTRLRRLGLRDDVAAGTFHALAYAQLRSRWVDRGIEPPTLLDRKVGFVARLLPPSTSSGTVTALDVVSEIEWAKARTVSPDDYPDAAARAGRTPSVDLGVVARTYQRYEEEKRRRRMVDFDDLLRLCRRDLERDEAFGAAQRWRFRHLFVDEFQDVNPLQYGLLLAWLGDRTDLCVVGDPNQAIYAWNGADAAYLRRFAELHPTAEVVVLEDNYRSSPQILGVANAVLGGAPRRLADPTATVRRLRANRADGELPGITRFDDDTAEAAGVARAVRDHHRPGGSWSMQAVLVRTNAQVALLEEALRASQIPFRVRGGAALGDQPEVKERLAALRRSTGAFRDALADLEAGLGPAADESAVTDGAGGGGGGGGGAIASLSPQRRANVEALVRLGHDYLAIDPAPSTMGFLAWLTDTTRADQPDVDGDAVEICTFHAAKGLEWPVVHLAGLEQGLVPIAHARTADEHEEERRLFYVAVTRAERVLCCTWAARRTFGRRTSNRERSVFLDDVEIACEVLSSGDEPADWAPVIAHLRSTRRQPRPVTPPSTTPRPGTGGAAARSSARAATSRRETHGRPAHDVPAADQPLYDALKAWRRSAAAASTAPDHVIFHDAALAEIAAARPTTLEALADLAGVGALKAGRFGDAVLALVAEHTKGAADEAHPPDAEAG